MGTGILESAIDKTIIAAKKIIYRNRQQGRPYRLSELKACLKGQMVIEEYQSHIDGDDRKFIKTWESLYQFII